MRNPERGRRPWQRRDAVVGHKAEVIYRRYAIVNDADLHAAAVRLAALSDTGTGTITGTVARLEALPGKVAVAKEW